MDMKNMRQDIHPMSWRIFFISMYVKYGLNFRARRPGLMFMKSSNDDDVTVIKLSNDNNVTLIKSSFYIL